jgi:sigma-E factor negative regulatory protein RseA
MDTNKKIREHISALSDGELSASDIELAFAALRSQDGQHAWEVYHRIGDVLRAQASPDLSPDFSERLAVRLAREPSHGRRIAAAGQEAAPAVLAAQSSAPTN